MIRAGRHLCLLGDANSVHLRRWAQQMIDRDWSVSVVTARPQAIDGVEQRVLEPVRRSADWLWRVGAARRHVASLAPDIVHAHYVSSYGYLAARCDRRPCVMTAWGSDLLVTPRQSRAMHWLTGWTLRRADLITGDSSELVELASAYAPSVPARLVHWGADTDRFAPTPWRDKPGFQIASLRSWEPNYHIDTLLEAFAQLPCSRLAPPATLHLLGGGAGEVALRRQAQALGIADRVCFHGRLDDAGMIRVLASCKVAVSVPASDATSVALLESMACGLAVVASALPANRAWLGEDPALMPSPGDAAALARALRRLCDDDALAQRLGAENRARVLRDGRRATQMDAMAALYEELLEKAGPRR
jgi:glycosyltransferase involved in cell wall biosynthesis